ncbi:MAG: chemotaxis protein CheC [bacterium]|jgi:chemotaxis protein CheC|nr:MAG: CheY-P-specific phosphatase CheC [bacterium]
MIDVRELDALQLDGLREVANIGAGHAATALSQLTNRRITVQVPEIRVVPLEAVPELIGKPDQVIAAVVMQVLGDLTGRTVQVFPGTTASRLAGILLGREYVPFPEGFGEIEQSALREAGNILAGAYLNALSEMLGMLLLSSVPSLAVDMAAAVLTASVLNLGVVDDPVLCIDTLFQIDEHRESARGHFLLLPDNASLRVILRAIRLETA